jgi:hypothetical protein
VICSGLLVRVVRIIRRKSCKVWLDIAFNNWHLGSQVRDGPPHDSSKSYLHSHDAVSCSTMEAPPWNSWSLDEQFFDSLCRWTKDNSGNSLTSILDKISAGIDDNRDLRAVIPDSPFPARSLIEALLHLLKLGIVRFRQLFSDRMSSYCFTSPY